MGDCAFASEFFSDTETGEKLVFLELTPACNNQCYGCLNVFKSNRNQTPLLVPDWIKIIDNISPSVQFLKITGGEPTLHPDFEQIISYISMSGFQFTLLTNGRWENPQRLLTFLGKVSGFKGFLISLHGKDCSAHEGFSGVVGSFTETINNIKLAKMYGFKVSTSSVLTQFNHKDIKNIINLSESLGADCTVFNRYIGKELPGLSLIPADEKNALLEINDFIFDKNNTKMIRYGVPAPFCFINSKNSRCFAGDAIATIDPWGNLRPCNHVPFICGNLLESSFEDTWYGTRMNRWREFVPEPCRDCEDFYRCKGGCRANILLQHIKCDPLMSMNES